MLKKWLERYGMTLETIYTTEAKKHIKGYKVINIGLKYVPDCKNNIIRHIGLSLDFKTWNTWEVGHNKQWE